jgi:Holliday junction DNA helicase RuvA
MILELKDKLAKLDRQTAAVGTVTAAKGVQAKEDALSALVNLGYKGSAVKEVVERILREAPEVPSLDQILKRALRTLAS